MFRRSGGQWSAGRAGVALALAALASCGASAPVPLAGDAGSKTALSDPAAGIPERLAETGLYADFASRRLADDAWPYDPQYPLWTDGAAKQRWIRVPAGRAVDASDPDAWVFPVGTRLWKEFALEGRPVETRYLEKRADGSWLRATYAWNAEGSDALLAPERGVRGAAEAAPGVPYDVPGRADCATCHAHGDGVLGFTALQLSADRDPLALHASPDVPPGQDLAAFVARGLVRGLPQELLDAPPRLRARSPRERAALGYLGTHCGSCHDGGGLLGGLGLALDARVGAAEGAQRALASLLDHPSLFRPADAPDCTVRVRPGEPDASVLLRRMSTRDPVAQMPPIGTHVVDHEAVALIEAWIRDDLAATP